MTRPKDHGLEARIHVLAAAMLGTETPFFDLLEEREPAFLATAQTTSHDGLATYSVVVGQAARSFFAAAARAIRTNLNPNLTDDVDYLAARRAAMAAWTDDEVVQHIQHALDRLRRGVYASSQAHINRHVSNAYVQRMSTEAIHNASEIAESLASALTLVAMPDAERVVRDTYADALAAARCELAPAKRKKR